jgi:UbiD family decarboxylase
MAYRDMRDLIAVLEQCGKLRRVTKSVERDWELACMARWMFQGLDEADRFGLLFENIEGFETAVATGVIGSSREAYAIALGVEPDEINDKWVEALCDPIAPCISAAALCHEVVNMGDDADLDRIPIPVWTPGKDAAPYISCPVITRDADNGVYNVGVYRTMIVDGRTAVINLGAGRHGMRCVQSYWDRGEPAPIAWAVGAEPVVNLAAVANVPYGTDELAVAGGLAGEPVELVPAKTIDLLVPATAEYIIEAEIRPGEIAEEGPFGEFAGFMNDAMDKRPVAHITAITHRRNPIYYGFISQMPPSESTTLQSIGYAGLITKMLRHDLGHETVKDVHVDFTFGGQMAHGTIAMKPRHPRHAKQVGRIVADATTLKRVTVVDDDIDIRDPMHMAWAMNSRFSPARDTVIIDDTFAPGTMDPTLEVVDGVTEPSSKIVCDATQKRTRGTYSLPSKELMNKALESWSEAGLPEFAVPKRARSMIEQS